MEGASASKEEGPNLPPEEPERAFAQVNASEDVNIRTGLDRLGDDPSDKDPSGSKHEVVQSISQGEIVDNSEQR